MFNATILETKFFSAVAYLNNILDHPKTYLQTFVWFIKIFMEYILQDEHLFDLANIFQAQVHNTLPPNDWEKQLCIIHIEFIEFSTKSV